MLKHETLGDGGKVTWGKVTGGFKGNFTSENPAKLHLVLTLVENRILKIPHKDILIAHMRFHLSTKITITIGGYVQLGICKPWLMNHL